MIREMNKVLEGSGRSLTVLFEGYCRKLSFCKSAWRVEWYGNLCRSMPVLRPLQFRGEGISFTKEKPCGGKCTVVRRLQYRWAPRLVWLFEKWTIVDYTGK